MAYKSRIPQIVAEINAAMPGVVNRAGYRMEAEAKSRARVDTGYMRGQIRWMELSPTSGELVAGATYTIFNEYGTVNMSAQPMFLPALEIVRPLMLKEVRLVLRKAMTSGRI